MTWAVDVLPLPLLSGEIVAGNGKGEGEERRAGKRRGRGEEGGEEERERRAYRRRRRRLLRVARRPSFRAFPSEEARKLARASDTGWRGSWNCS
jgi:hypothetical protein